MHNVKNMHNRDAKKICTKTDAQNICIKQMHKNRFKNMQKIHNVQNMLNMLNVQQKMQRMQKVLKCKKDAKEMLNRCTAYAKQMHNRDANKICTKTDAKICKGCKNAKCAKYAKCATKNAKSAKIQNCKRDAKKMHKTYA